MDVQIEHSIFQTLGPATSTLGLLLLALAMYGLAVQLRSVFLRLSAVALLICVFVSTLTLFMPVHFEGIDDAGRLVHPTLPPAWVAWLQIEGVPLALLSSGVFACISVVMRWRKQS